MPPKAAPKPAAKKAAAAPAKAAAAKPATAAKTTTESATKTTAATADAKTLANRWDCREGRWHLNCQWLVSFVSDDQFRISSTLGPDQDFNFAAGHSIEHFDRLETRHRRLRFVQTTQSSLLSLFRF
jgi:hypothetical protein